MQGPRGYDATAISEASLQLWRRLSVYDAGQLAGQGARELGLQPSLQPRDRPTDSWGIPIKEIRGRWMGRICSDINTSLTPIRGVYASREDGKKESTARFVSVCLLCQSFLKSKKPLLGHTSPGAMDSEGPEAENPVLISPPLSHTVKQLPSTAGLLAGREIGTSHRDTATYMLTYLPYPYICHPKDQGAPEGAEAGSGRSAVLGPSSSPASSCPSSRTFLAEWVREEAKEQFRMVPVLHAARNRPPAGR
ncbi:hypothetical protein GGR56DRAFT_114094 [Xylariaceae sp. FL0804]|nr:hypothetical protein GGR56DRAFT_114094 [Xylariaceae sp. FL0804]